jgi:dTDP-glucose pyrophosphorylase/CBS domain-containing protein
MHTDLTTLCVGLDTSIHQAVAQMDISRLGIVLVVDEEHRLLGTVTDGDVRRSILANISLDKPVRVLLLSKAGSPYARPITAPADADQSTMLQILRQHRILHLPLVDLDQRVVALVSLSEFVSQQVPMPHAVIMAGGTGSRLRPLTDDLPKPMLPLGDRPLMELIIRQLQQVGIRHVNLTTHYKKDAIAQYFGDGQDFGVEIQYMEEDQPLGTAGALSRLDGLAGPLLVINGDILTRVDFRAMLDFHREHHADMTIGVRYHEVPIPYGVVEVEGVVVTAISEKPVMRYLISAGIYLLEPEVRRYIPTDRPYDMPDLIARLVVDGGRVVSFPVREYWLDIGRVEDYQKALADLESGEV